MEWLDRPIKSGDPFVPPRPWVQVHTPGSSSLMVRAVGHWARISQTVFDPPDTAASTMSASFTLASLGRASRAKYSGS